MVITVLSTDKITQNLFRSTLNNLSDFVIVGTHSNQDNSTLRERLAFIKSQTKDVIIFHALPRSRFALDKDWEPAAGLDFPKLIADLSDTIIYTPSLRQASFGKKVAVIKGTVTNLKIDVDTL
jgi:hypothetical protein